MTESKSTDPKISPWQFVTFPSRSIYSNNTLQLQPRQVSLYIYYTTDIDFKFTHMVHYL